MKKRVISILLVLAMCLSLMPLTVWADSSLTSIELDTHAAVFEPGETLQLTAKLEPETATSGAIKWSSSNEDILTVSDTGLVTAVDYGTASIYAFPADYDAESDVEPVDYDFCSCYVVKTVQPISLTWLDSNGDPITGAPANFTFDFSSYIEAYSNGDDYAAEEAYYDLRDEFYNAVEEYLRYGYNSYWNVVDVKSYCSVSGVFSALFSNLFDYSPVEPAYTLQRYGSYDKMTIAMFGSDASTYTFSNWPNKYTVEYAELFTAIEEDTTGTYLPAQICVYSYYNGLEYIHVAKTAEQLIEVLGGIADICSEYYKPSVEIDKFEEKSMNFTWFDGSSQPLTGDEYPASYTMPLLDYYAADTSTERDAAFEAAEQDFLSKFSTALNWDNGFGTWDVLPYDDYEYDGYLYSKQSSEDLFDLLFENIDYYSNVKMTRHNDAFAINWNGEYDYTLSDFYVEETSELNTEAWQEKYEEDLTTQIENAFTEDQKLYVQYSLYDADNTLTETGYIRNEEELTEMLNGLPQRCREDGVYYVTLSAYTGDEITITWHDKDGNVIEGLPTSYSVDLSLGPAGCGEKFYDEYKDILSQYSQFANLDDFYGDIPDNDDYDDPWDSVVTNAQDVMAFMAVEIEYGNTSFDFYEYNGNYIFKGEVAYKLTSNEYYGESIDMWGYYNYHWLNTTYDNDGYHTTTSGLDGATVIPKVTVANGKNLVLSYMVTAPADKAIVDGKLGIWTDVMVGDNDGATIRTIFDDAGNKIGFDLIDDGWHSGSYYECYAYNAKYSCYVAGEMLVNAASKILKIENPVEGKFWYGYYGDADRRCFDELNASTSNGTYNDDYTELYNTDSGAAASWDVNLAAGASQTYCVAFGIVDATMNVAPRFIGEDPAFGEQGYVTVDVANYVADGSTGHYILLSLDTTEGEQLDAGRAYLYDNAAKLFKADPETGIKDNSVSAITELFTENDEYQKNDQVAQFIVSEVNAFPDTYVITGVTATNDGGETAEYVLKDEGFENFTMVIPATGRTAPLSLTNPEVLENLREGWSYDPDTQELTAHGLAIDVEEGPALELPAGTEIVLESFETVTENESEEPGEEPVETPVAVNKIAAQEGAAIEVVPGEEPTKISGKGSLVVEAPVGISAEGGDLTISGGDIVINASELGIACETLTVNGGSLTINLPEEGGEFLNVSALVIPEDYEIIGGTIDAEGNFVPAEGKTQLIIRQKPYTSPTVEVPVSGEENSMNVKATVSGNVATVKPVDEEEIQKVIGSDVNTGMVEIDLSGTKNEITAVKLPTETVAAIAEAAAETGNDTAGLKLELSSGTLEFDAKALETIVENAGDAAQIEIHFDEVGTKRLNNVQKDAVADMDVVMGYEAYITVNGTRVSDFNGGSVVVYIPYEIPEGKNPAGYTVWFVAEDGTLEKMNTSYDGANHRFVVTHFSDYVLTYDENAAFVNCAKDDTCPISKFTDADANAWYHNGVHYCLDNGIMAGFTNGTFKPNGTTTRAQIVTILYNLEGKPAFMNDNIFTDVASGSWYEMPIVWAQGKGIVSGYGDGTFRPDEPISREELAVILWNYAQYKGIDVSVDENTNFLSFNDFWDISEWAKPAMMWAVENELIVGNNWDLKPQGDALRAQAATIVWKFCENIVK